MILNDVLIVRVDKAKNYDLKIVLKCKGRPDADYTPGDEKLLRGYWDSDASLKIMIESDQAPQNEPI